MSAILFVFWHVIGLVTMNFAMKLVADDLAEGWANRVMAAINARMLQVTKRYGMIVTALSFGLALMGVSILAIGMIRAL